MRKYLKKRKHRNGVRPKRKGTLKVRMVTLPSFMEQLKGVNRRLIEYSTTNFDDKFPKWPCTVAEMNRYKVNVSRREACLRTISLMQRAYRFCDTHEQINPGALSAAVQDNSGGSIPTCKGCKYDGSFLCIFNQFEYDQKTKQIWCTRLNGGNPLTGQEMEKLSLLATAHLS
jgi:hypothetical protein